MTTLTLSDILDDLRVAEEDRHKFERRDWISSDDFFAPHTRGPLDDGENAQGFAEWAGHCQPRQTRPAALEQLSQQRLETLRQHSEPIRLTPAEPALKLA